jgi:dCMP deaminase
MSAERLSKDETWMAMAFIAARRSLCDRSQTGAVIVSAQNRIVATGYNGPPTNLRGVDGRTCSNWCARAATGAVDASRGYLTCPSIHAEANALLYASRRDIEGGTMYVTRVPCWDCAKLIGNSGIVRVMCIIDDPADADRETGVALKMLADSGLEVAYGAGYATSLHIVK